jgi:hypothetical protein
MADGQAQHKRYGQAECRHQQNGPAVFLFLQMREIEIQANLEHQQDQPDLAHDRYRRCGNGMKHVMEGIRRQGAEQARPEQEADDDFADYAGLSETQGQRPADARRQQDQNQLHEGKKQQIFCCMHGNGGGCGC